MVNPVELPERIVPVLFGPARYKVLRGGRGSAKSWSIARYLVLKTAFGRYRILCTREMQNSIKESVHKLLVDQIYALELQKYFRIEKENIYSLCGSHFIFKGLHHNISEIKSTEGVDICWVEEAEKVSEDSWTTLIPTIRNDGSEILISFNPENEKSPTYVRFAKSLPPDCLSAALTYADNPWFPKVLRREMEYDKRVDYDKYEYVWLGKPKKYSHALIFHPNKIRIEEFEAPPETRLFFGADFGFSTDPTVLVRAFIKNRKLYIDYEAYGHGVEIQDLPEFFKTVPGCFQEGWKIIADSARPDTINYLEQKGFSIAGAEKGKGSVEDGIEFIRSFEEIVIHPRCKGTRDNFENYKWKQDKITNEILPIPAEGSDHAPDAVRYALESYIKYKVTWFDALDGNFVLP